MTFQAIHSSLSAVPRERQDRAAATSAEPPSATPVVRPPGEQPFAHVLGRHSGGRLQAAFPGPRLVDATHREIAADEVYREQRLFHATSVNGRESIREHGFQLSKKTSAGVAAYLKVKAKPQAESRSGNLFGAQDTHVMEAGRKHHFVFSSFREAWMFGRRIFRHVRDRGRPVVTRLFRGDLTFEPDPDYPGYPDAAIAFRTANDIPKDQILNSKKMPPSAGEKEMMRSGLERKGICVTPEEAGALLRAVQSDSEDDDEEPPLLPRSNGDLLDESGKPRWREIRARNLTQQELVRILNSRRRHPPAESGA